MIVAECFLPEINGVTNSVLRVVEHLERRHHEVLVIAPGIGPTIYSRTPVERVPAISLPFYRSLSVGLPTSQLRSLMARFRPDVVHLAAPVVLGAAALRAAASLRIPTVAVYQTDVAGFGSRYGLGFAGDAVWSWLRWLHNQADLTLAPSTSAAWALSRQGILKVARWGRGVDTERFDPAHRSASLRRSLASRGEVLVGYVGRLAPEKQVHLLRHVEEVKGTRTVVVGDGPSASRLRAQMPHALFAGTQSGLELSRYVASFDLFVHTGVNETFCQAVQEALASGVPVIAPAAGGPLDTVRHGFNGFLYPPDRPEMLAEAVRDLVLDPGLRETMGRQARESVLGRDWASLGDELIGHYQRVGGPGRSIRRAA